MRGRMYDATVRTFLTPDPIVGSPFKVTGWNKYAYVRNNPLKFVDPSGFYTDGEVSDSDEVLWNSECQGCDSSDTNEQRIAPPDNNYGFEPGGTDGDNSSGPSLSLVGTGGNGPSIGPASRPTVDPVAQLDPNVGMGQAVAEVLLNAVNDLLDHDKPFLVDGNVVNVRVPGDPAKRASALGLVVLPGALALGDGAEALAAVDAAEGLEKGAASKILNFTERDLQKGFMKHGEDFGLEGNWNPSR